MKIVIMGLKFNFSKYSCVCFFFFKISVNVGRE